VWPERWTAKKQGLPLEFSSPSFLAPRSICTACLRAHRPWRAGRTTRGAAASTFPGSLACPTAPPACSAPGSPNPNTLQVGKFLHTRRSFIEVHVLQPRGDGRDCVPDEPEKVREFSLDKDSQGLCRPATILLRRRFSAVTTGTQRMAIDPGSPTMTAGGVWGAGTTWIRRTQSGVALRRAPVRPPTGSSTRDQVFETRRTWNVTTHAHGLETISEHWAFHGSRAASCGWELA